MAAELQFVENSTVVIVPPPNRGRETPARLGGRYRMELRAAGETLTCGHQADQALLWLIFLEADQEAGREVTEVICSACDPARFARAQAWAEALA
ncbi:MAG: hypothetical protein HY656_00665 [Acidobacteria bacterium]|nr:hypothetical protein [Acidobacteriota bacterium]